MAGGPAFLRPPHEFTVRLCYVNFDGTQALAASEEIGLEEALTETFLHEYCTPVVDGIQVGLYSVTSKMTSKLVMSTLMEPLLS